MAKNDRRVVVTGLGPVTPIGIGIEEFRDALLQGKNGISLLPVDEYTEDFPIKIAGQICDFDSSNYGIDVKSAKRMSRPDKMGIAATGLALKNARLHIGNQNGDVLPEDVDICLGVGIGGNTTSMIEMERFSSGKKIKPFTVPQIMPNSAAAQIGLHYGIKGEAVTTNSACASSGTAIGDAYYRIKGGKDVIVVGGLEACINKFSLSAFDSMRALSRSEEPKYQVYDENSQGFVMGEGAGMLVLESEEHALERDAPIYAEILGYGASTDAQHIASPDLEGRQLSRAVRLSLKDAGISPEEIKYVNSHGTGTMNDRIETKVMKDIFGDLASEIPISSTKPMIGHLLGGATAVETIATILAMNYNFLPGTINLEKSINGLNYVKEARTHQYTPKALKFSSGFGGHNTSLVLGRYIRS